MQPSLRPTVSPDDIDRLARRRAGAKLGWLVHAGVYTAVQLALVALAFVHAQAWSPYPALGWGLGLLLHGAAVWLALPGSRWHETLVAQERAALVRERSRRGGAVSQ